MARARKKAKVDQTLCVACGCCERVCPLGAIQVDHGRWAVVKEETCVGCGKCAKICPASVIDLVEVPV